VLVCGSVYVLFSSYQICGIAISEDNLHCVMSGADGNVYIHNICSTELLDTFTGQLPVSDMVVSTDNHFIFTAAKVISHLDKNLARFQQSYATHTSVV
jgi:hypothetical protein